MNKTSLVFLALIVLAVGVAGFWYFNREATRNFETTKVDPYVSLGDNAKRNDSVRIVTSPFSTNDDSIDISTQSSKTVEFIISTNGVGSCSQREYKIEFGDGTIDWLGIDEGSCAPKVILYNHAYLKAGTYTAILHDTTDLQYYESAFDTPEVVNPVSSVTVNIPQ